MLDMEAKKDIKELTVILMKLDDTDRTIMLSNAMALLARQEIAKGEVGRYPFKSQRPTA